MEFRRASFRPTSGRVLTVVVAAVAAAALVAVALDTPLDLLRYGWVPVFVAALCWALFWAPELRVEEHAVIVRNVLATTHVPWPAIRLIDTKYALTLFLEGRRKVTVWVAPAPGRVAVASLARGDARHVPESARGAGGSVRPADAVPGLTGAAALAVRRHWEQLRDDGVFDRITADQRPRVEWHVATIAVLLALLAASIAAPALIPPA